MNTHHIENAVCPFCGCLCDDIRLTVSQGQITGAGNACALGKAGFLEVSPPLPAALIDGVAAEFDSAIAAAAQLLVQARSPLIYGLHGIPSEAQRLAVALADLLSASLDTAASELQRAAALALQQGGANTATLGEVKNRADLVIFWGADPLVTHPRHLERYSALPRGHNLPNGRRSRTVIVLDEAPTASAQDADLFVPIAAHRHFEVLWALRALLRGQPTVEPTRLAEAAGLPLETLQELLARLRGCRSGVVFYGPRLAAGPAGPHIVSALFALVRELNEHVPFSAMALAGQGNAAGAENVLAWQTGYPHAVNFGRGYPRYNPREFAAAELLARGETDAVLLIGSGLAAALPPAALAALRQLPTVALGTPAAAGSRVTFNTARPGIEAGGTYYRMDEVPLTLRPVQAAALPPIEGVLQALTAQVTSLVVTQRVSWPARKAALAGGQGG